MDSRWLGGAVVIIIVALGGWYVFSHPSSPAPITETRPVTDQTSTTTTTTTSTNMPLAPVTVMYTDNGFSPASVTIAQGQTVTWVNQASDKMWVASGVHPTHMVYDGTSKSQHCVAGYAGPVPLDECAAVASGASYSFTFDKAGDWKYHNHTSAADIGEIVVTAAPAVTASTTTVNAH